MSELGRGKIDTIEKPQGGQFGSESALLQHPQRASLLVDIVIDQNF